MEALTTTGNDRIKPGGNNPPAFDAHAANIADIREEAGAWLTGETIKSAEEAEAVKLLLDMARKAAKAADDERASEKEPHLTASKAVDAKWKPLITSAQTMADVCKEILTPWNIAEAARKEAEAAVARAAAEAERQAEVEATRAAAGNIDAREQADQLAASAKQAETIAKRAERAAGNARQSDHDHDTDTQGIHRHRCRHGRDRRQRHQQGPQQQPAGLFVPRH